jgi:hypothetical protein
MVIRRCGAGRSVQTLIREATRTPARCSEAASQTPTMDAIAGSLRVGLIADVSGESGLETNRRAAVRGRRSSELYVVQTRPHACGRNARSATTDRHVTASAGMQWAASAWRAGRSCALGSVQWARRRLIAIAKPPAANSIAPVGSGTDGIARSPSSYSGRPFAAWMGQEATSVEAPVVLST